MPLVKNKFYSAFSTVIDKKYLYTFFQLKSDCFTLISNSLSFQRFNIQTLSQNAEVQNYPHRPPVPLRRSERSNVSLALSMVV